MPVGWLRPGDRGACRSTTRARVTWRSSGDGPSRWCEPEAEHAETGDVGGSGEEVEVGVDFQSPAYACAAPPVATAHQVGELAFDFGAHRPIVGFPADWLVAGGPQRGPLRSGRR